MSFATADDLAGRLGRTFTVDEQAQADLLLADATAHLRGLIGSDVTPRRTSTFTIHADVWSEWVDVPVRPLISIDAVEVNGQAVSDVEVVDGRLYRRHGWNRLGIGYSQVIPVEVTATYGYEDAPQDLVAWTCVLAAQALAATADTGALAGGSVTNVRIDDYSKSWSAGDEAGAFHVPPHAIDTLRSRYGSSAAVTGRML